MVSDEAKQRKAEARRIRMADPQYRAQRNEVDNRSRKIRRKEANYRISEMERDRETLEAHSSIQAVYETWISSAQSTCVSCHGLFFANNLIKIKNIDKLPPSIVADLHLSKEVELCLGCYGSIKSGKYPRYCHLQLTKLRKIPQCIKELNDLESRIVARRLPYATIKAASYEGQKSIIGNVVNIPFNCAKVAEVLPRRLDESEVYLMGLKSRYSDKKWMITDYVRVKHIKDALEYLITTPLYQDVKISYDWFAEHEGVYRIPLLIHGIEHSLIKYHDNSINIETLPLDSLKSGAYDQSMLDHHDDEFILSVSPGKLQAAVSLLFDNYAEELSFPKIFCGHTRNISSSIHQRDRYATIARYEVRNKDRRFCNPGHILYKMKLLHLFTLFNCVRIFLKRSRGDVTAGQLKNPYQVNRMMKDHEAFQCFGKVRNTPFYFKAIRTKLKCMIRQFGVPTFFLTLSAADTHWPDLLTMLIAHSDHPSISKKTVNDLSHEEKCYLIAHDPVTCARYFDKKVKAFIRLLQHKHGPFAPYIVKHYLFRVEFQHRGSPHIHGLIWLEGAPTFDGKNGDLCAQFFDSFIVSDSTLDPNKLQIHRHSKIGCLRAGKCRFNFPKLPIDRTIFLTPILKEGERDVETLDLIKDRLQKCEIRDFEEFLSELNISREKYIHVLRSSIERPKIFEKRRPCDSMVNNFNPLILSLHQANMDIQFAFEPYSIVSYCTNYVTKPFRSISSCMTKILKQCKRGNKSVKDALYSLCGYYLHHTEISAQEASWYLLGQNFVYSNCTDIYIPTIDRSTHSRMTKPKHILENLPDESTDVFQDGLLEHYIDRPDALESMCLADFAAKTNYSTQENPKHENMDEGNELDIDSVKEFNSLPLKMRNGRGYVRIRKTPKLIRYMPAERESQLFKCQQVMLFLPWRNLEVLDDHAAININFESNHILIKAKLKEYNILGIQDDTLDDMFSDSDETSSCIDSNHKEYQLRPDECILEFQRATGEVSYDDPVIHLTRAPLSDRGIVKDMVRSLNSQQREYLRIACRFVRTNRVFHHFITGGAGTGKSHLLKVLYNVISRILDDVGIVLLAAPTGKAAANIGASTLHSLLFLPHVQEKRSREQLQLLPREKLAIIREKLMGLRILIIDEISMVGGTMFRHVSDRLKQILGRNQVFGGVSIICIGDLHQLPPVGDSPIYQHGRQSNPLSILSEPEPLWFQFNVFHLTEIMRQRDDLAFAEALSNFANDSLTARDITLFRSREFIQEPKECDKDCIRLAFTNVETTALNQRIVESIQGDIIECIAEDKITRKLQNCRGSENNLLEICQTIGLKETKNLAYNLELKINVNYLVIKNIDVSKGIVNGTIGVLLNVIYENAKPSKLQLRDVSSKQIFTIERTLEYIVRKTFTFSRKQFPIVPAHAITIHKSQGSTYDKVVAYMPLRPNKAALYVALSRCRTLDGLFIIGSLNLSVKSSDTLRFELSRLDERKVSLEFIPNTNRTQFSFYNIQSWKQNSFEITDNPDIMRSDVICLAETLTLVTDVLELPGYILQHHRPSDNRRLGTGMVCFVRIGQSIDSCECECFKVDDAAITYIALTTANTKIIFVYCSPSVNERIISEFVLSQNETRKTMTIMGDFNNDCRKGSKLSTVFLDRGYINITDYDIASTDSGTYIDGAFSSDTSMRAVVHESSESFHRPICTFKD